jgi:hypothetical protein
MCVSNQNLPVRLTCSRLLLSAMKLAARIVGEENMSCTAAKSAFKLLVDNTRLGLEFILGSLSIISSVIEIKNPASTGRRARDARVENCRFIREEFLQLCRPMANDCSPLYISNSLRESVICKIEK